MSLKASIILAPLLIAAACSSELGDAGEDSPTGPNGPGTPGTPDVTMLQGDYEVTSKYDLSQSPDLPSQLTDALGPLTSLSDNPVGALIDLLDGSGSGLADLLDAIPGPIRAGIEAQINDYIQDKIGSNNTAGNITEYVELLSNILTNFEVITELEVGSADSAGNASASHTLEAVAFPRDGARTVIASPDVLNQLSSARDVSLSVDFGNSSLAVGDHAFHLPLGEFAVLGFHKALEEKFGITDLGAALGDLVDCGGLAAQVGDIEAFGFVVVTEDMVSDFCTDGLNKIPEKINDQIRKLEFAELHFVGGEGSVGMASDSVNTMQGTWDSEIGFNGNGFSVPATFEAKRAN